MPITRQHVNPQPRLGGSKMLKFLAELGERDAKAGKPIEAFYQIQGIRYSERERSAYEIGYRAAKRNPSTAPRDTGAKEQ
jgi:hypothetical protein